MKGFAPIAVHFDSISVSAAAANDILRHKFSTLVKPLPQSASAKEKYQLNLALQ